MNDLLGEKPRIIRKLPAVKELIHPDEEQSEEVDVDAELVNDENGDDENALMDKIASFLTLNRDVMSMISGLNGYQRFNSHSIVSDVGQ